MNDTSIKRVLIIDRQSFWRDKVASALSGQGYEIQILSSYDYDPEGDANNRRLPDLIILGCPSLQREERDLINRILASHRHLVVFCSSLPWGDMRTLFMAGADDVADKPYDPARVITMVEEAFANMAKSNRPTQPQEHVGAL